MILARPKLTREIILVEFLFDMRQNVALGI